MKNLTLTLFTALMAVGCYHTNNQTGDPPECVTASDCEDGVECTIDFCDNGTCQMIDTCEDPPDCESAADCEDGVECTIDYCDAGVCQVVDLCEEPACDHEINSFTLPTEAVDMDVATNGSDMLALVWQESTAELSMSYAAALFFDYLPEESFATPLDEREDVTLRHPRIIWHETNASVFWSSQEGSVQLIKMAELDAAGGYLFPPTVLYSDHDSALSQVVYHPSGELGITWSDWAESGADPLAFFGRYNLDGELIEKVEVSNGEYAYAPRLEALSDGYMLVFTHYLSEPGYSNALMKNYSFTDGMDEHPTRLNAEDGRFIAGPVTTTSEQELALMYNEVTADIKLLSLSLFSDGEERGSIPLFLMSKAADALGSVEGEDAFVGWCSPITPDSPSAVTVIRVNSFAITLMFYQEMEAATCEDIELVWHGAEPMIFWLDSESRVSFRSLCVP